MPFLDQKQLTLTGSYFQVNYFHLSIALFFASHFQWLLSFESLHCSANNHARFYSQKIIKGKIVNVAHFNQRHCLEECGQWLENID